MLLQKLTLYSLGDCIVNIMIEAIRNIGNVPVLHQYKLLNRFNSNITVIGLEEAKVTSQ